MSDPISPNVLDPLENSCLMEPYMAPPINFELSPMVRYYVQHLQDIWTQGRGG